MEVIEGKRRGSQLHLLHNFLYRQDANRGNGTIGYRCIKEGCPGRVVEKNGAVEVRGAHNHEADEEEVGILRLKAALKRKAGESSRALREVFEEVCQDNPNGTDVGFAEVESSMYRERRRLLPALPTAAAEAYPALLAAPPQYSTAKLKPAAEREPGEADVQVTIVQHGESTTEGDCIVLAHPHMLEQLRASDRWHMDGTFKVVPHLFYQLLTIGFIWHDYFWPSVYILLSRKTTAIYEAALRAVLQLCAGTNVQCIISDYEAALMNAASSVFPSARVTGCWFHFTQAIVNKFKVSSFDDCFLH